MSDGTSTVSGTATVGVGGAFSVTGLDITNLDDGPLEVTASLSDTAGNAAVPATRTIQLDNTAPVVSITIDSITADNIVNATEDDGNVTVTG